MNIEKFKEDLYNILKENGLTSLGPMTIEKELPAEVDVITSEKMYLFIE